MLRANEEFIHPNGETYKVVRTSGTNTYEIMLVADRNQTMQKLLSQGKSAGFNNEQCRIKAAANWMRSILQNNKDKK